MKFLLFTVLLLYLSACTSPERKAKSAIKRYMYETAHDFDSYEPVEFGKLDSSFAISDLPWEKVIELRKKIIWSEIDGSENSNISTKLSDSLDTLEAKFTGFKIRHKFRVANQFGAKMMVEGTFFLDIKLQNVRRFEEIQI